MGEPGASWETRDRSRWTFTLVTESLPCPARFNLESMRWERWQDAPEVHTDSIRKSLAPEQLLAVCPKNGWPSIKRASSELEVSQAVAKRELEAAAVAASLFEVS